MQAGACVCFIEPGLASEAVAEQAETVGMRYLVVDESLVDRFADQSPRSLAVRGLGTLNSGGVFIDDGLDGNDTAMLLFTSGSTGRPKGVVLRHGSLICNADGVLRHTGTSPQDRLLHVMPLSHERCQQSADRPLPRRRQRDPPRPLPTQGRDRGASQWCADLHDRRSDDLRAHAPAPHTWRALPRAPLSSPWFDTDHLNASPTMDARRSRACHRQLIERQHDEPYPFRPLTGISGD
ncbi:AMP-binding protein [Methylobacterium oxalidis]